MITIVDDDESVREATMSLLRASGFKAEAFSCADDFLKSERLLHTDCLVSDVQMPGMSGLELHEHLVRSGNDIPTILITAYPDEAARIRAKKDGVVCYLAKPFNENQLLDCIASAIERSPQRSS
jgi:FixJ family two-component response regulator